ncbi:MAG: RNA polymerase sigma factor [Patescibacteria group bacterium]|mgnify:CR=1 FL=1
MNRVSRKVLQWQLQTKDPDVFGRFYDLYIERVYRFIYFKVSSQEEAEDLAAETFLKVWQHLLDGKKIEHVNAFVYQIARNVVIDWYRKRASHKMVDIEDEQLMAVPDEAPSVEDTIALKFDAEQLAKYLRQLKEEYRDIIILKYLDELSVEEIATVLDTSRGNVRVLTHRALATLRQIIEQDNHHALS